MHKISISSSGGFSLEAETYEADEFYRKSTFENPYSLQTDIFALSTNENIAGFKDKWRIHKINHLSLGPCGIHQFTIEDDIFTFRLGASVGRIL